MVSEKIWLERMAYSEANVSSEHRSGDGSEAGSHSQMDLGRSHALRTRTVSI